MVRGFSTDSDFMRAPPPWSMVNEALGLRSSSPHSLSSHLLRRSYTQPSTSAYEFRPDFSLDHDKQSTQVNTLLNARMPLGWRHMIMVMSWRLKITGKWTVCSRYCSYWQHRNDQSFVFVALCEGNPSVMRIWVHVLASSWSGEEILLNFDHWFREYPFANFVSILCIDRRWLGIIKSTAGYMEKLHKRTYIFCSMLIFSSAMW